jgi:predicted TIM-barrel fold metal-dependent hydrolase
VETILEPDLLICDPHHHLWDRPGDRYLISELRRDTHSGHRVEQTVYIECRSAYREVGPEAFRPVGETDFVVGDDPDGFVAGIVGFANLQSPEIEDVLGAHIEAGMGRFRGVRHSVNFDPSPEIGSSKKNDPGLLADPAFRAGIAALGRMGLSFDAWLFHPQIPELTSLARAHPEVPIVIEHLGMPLGVGPYRGKSAEVLDDWGRSLRELAQCPNVAIKLGGLGMYLFGTTWHEDPERPTSVEIARKWGDVIAFCIDLFGVDRAMFESNFPVDAAAFEYATIWNAYKLIAAGASPTEKAALFHDTAVSFYRLGPPAGT